MTPAAGEAPPASRARYDLAAAALTLAGAGLVAALFPDGDWTGGILAAAAAVMALCSVVLPGRSTRWGVVALVVALAVVMWSVVPQVLVAEPSDSLAGPAGIPEIPPGSTVVTYEISTDGLSVTHLSYVDLVDGAPIMVEALGVPPPFLHRIVVPPDSDLDLTDLSVTGMGGATSRQTACRITVDGRTVSTASADSSYGLVTCEIPRAPVG